MNLDDTGRLGASLLMNFDGTRGLALGGVLCPSGVAHAAGVEGRVVRRDPALLARRHVSAQRAVARNGGAIIETGSDPYRLMHGRQSKST